MAVGLALKIGRVLLAVWAATHQRADWSEFDVRRCYAHHQRLHCWPKDGCWLASDGTAICWRSNPKLKE